MKIQICDRISFAISQREYTDEGFLRVPGRVARVGIQDYLAGELGLDGDPMRIVRVMRPSEEVFNDASLESYASVDVTIEHPEGMVNSDTFKAVTVGVVRGSASQDGDFVVSDLIIKDKTAIAAVESGKVQLSAGYTALYDDNVPEGADYEFIQRDIRINHVALVDRARAGAQARLFDKQPELKSMVTLTLDNAGHSVEVADAATATLIKTTIDRLNTEVTTAQGETEKVTADRDLLQEQLDAATKLATPEALAARVGAIAKTKDMAVAIAGKDFTCDSVVLVEIQRAALAAKRPNITWSDKSDIYVQAAFDQGFEASEEEEEETNDDLHDPEEDKKKKKDAKDSHEQLAKDAAKGKLVSIGDARSKNTAAKTQAWKKNAGDA